MSYTAERLFARLSEPRVRREPAERTLHALDRLARLAARESETLIRLHERLLFLLGYPPSLAVRRGTERLLARLPRIVARLAASGADFARFDEPETAGIAGTTVSTEFSLDVTRWLLSRFPGSVGLDWSAGGEPDRLSAALPRFVPLLEEEALADANVPYEAWLAAARGAGEDLSWLARRFGGLPAAPGERAELFNALALPVSWDLGRAGASRTLLWRPVRNVFLHREPLLSRRDVSLERELAAPRLPVRRVSRREALAALDMARESTSLRYREFYGFTYGDPATGLAALPGRGVEIFLFGIEPAWRLPLRAGYTALVLKNGVPAAYFEGLCFFERMEAGFNVYYTFREGESAWIYAKVLKLCREVLGVTSFSIDPYQIGYRNEEAIESGAFWFYRKLGFRPTDSKVAALVAREEERIAARPGYRTPARVLRKIATCHLLYEVGSRQSAVDRKKSDWDRFHIRNIGLAVNRRMAREFGGDAAAIRRASAARVARVLRARPGGWNARRQRVFEDFALVLDLLADLARWTAREKEDLLAALRAKAGPNEASYLRRMRRHARLRRAMIGLGSGRRTA